MTQTGIQMLMKAMGFDPQVVVAKAQEVEQFLTQFATGVQGTVSNMQAQMNRMELMLATILEGQQQQGGPTQPAGESSVDLIPPALIAAAVDVEPEKEHKPNGRYTGNSRATRRHGKAH